jgi:N6-adenosine-specific RNA methylase IME4
MSNVKRGSESNYDVLYDDDIINLNVESIASDDSVLVLWVPSSKLSVGLETMEKWGFRQTQTFTWVKIKKFPFKDLLKNRKGMTLNDALYSLQNALSDFDFNTVVSMNLGRWFRQCHEVALVGVRGKVYNKLQDKAQRSVAFDIGLGHSKKTEILQNRLEKMLPPSENNLLEMFARRDRKNWVCVGLECPSTLNENIKDSIVKLSSI